jgi:2-keto-4-pentenoate hydratase/2-oxohepta-3-ene-1,7-dioic acid hydratase in catechol pathway
MRYLTFSPPGDTGPRLGVPRGDVVVDVRSLSGAPGAPPLPGSLLELIHQGPDGWRRLSEFLTSDGAYQRGRTYRLTDIRWHAPIPRPSKNVFCVGRNFLTHIEEGARERGEAVKLPDAPVFFTKAPTTVIGPFDDIPWDRSVTQQVDWEVELAAIVGVTGRNIRRGAALEHVFGYTVINDVSARDLQKNHFQFFKGKSLDGFCPIGPFVVTPDEFGDPQAKQLTLRVNGASKQSGNTRDMIYPLDTLIESLSHGLTLEAGDILACGTPDGCGFARTPPEFLQDGDVMETEVEGIGTMRNRIAAHS